MHCLIIVPSQLQLPLHTYLHSFCITHSKLMFSQSFLSHLVETYKKVLKMSEDFLYVLDSAISSYKLVYTWTLAIKYIFLLVYLVGGKLNT